MATNWLLTQNSKMKDQGIWNWTLPAWVVKLEGETPDGSPTVRTINVCPQASASACVKHCYALGSDSSYIRFPAVRARHLQNLRMIVDTPLLWKERMAAELRHPRYQPDPKKGLLGAIRIHDSGDFFNEFYLSMWLEIMRGAPAGLTFYSYTKSVSMFKKIVEPNPPESFKWLYSLGGKEDRLVDLEHDRHADVYPDPASLDASGYASQEASDTLAVYGPRRVGMAANRRRKNLTMSFGELQRRADEAGDARRERAKTKARRQA